MATIIMKQGVIGAKMLAIAGQRGNHNTFEATEEKAADRHASEIVAAGRYHQNGSPGNTSECQCAK
jgi:hypothetical protein